MTPPGFLAHRLAVLCERAVTDMRLDLRRRHVVTEAATGAYAVTPVLAALAGAETVTALTRETRYGSVQDVRDQTRLLADLVGVGGQIDVVTRLAPATIGQADVVTNSAHLRPLDAAFVELMKPDAVVPLMMEAWEIGAGRTDLDLDALRRRGIRHAGTNERNPIVGVFAFLGPMAVRLLGDAGFAALGLRVLVLCDNPFAPHLVDGLTRAGADVTLAQSQATTRADMPAPDVVLLAQRPTGGPLIDAARIRQLWPGTTVVQYWGDLDRAALEEARIPYWPHTAPAPGHMAVLPSAVGPEPVVRLQAGGLKVAQVLLAQAGGQPLSDEDLEFTDELHHE